MFTSGPAGFAILISFKPRQRRRWRFLIHRLADEYGDRASRRGATDKTYATRNEFFLSCKGTKEREMSVSCSSHIYAPDLRYKAAPAHATIKARINIRDAGL